MDLKSSLIATVAIRVAPNLTDEIICQLQDDLFSLKQCSLVSKMWRKRALRWLFATIVVQITATDHWSYLRWFEEPMPGFHLATTHARELRLVQYPYFMWITPSMLSSILPRFAEFRNISSLSLHSLSVHHFDDVDTRSVFGHFFPTVRKLDLEEPRATARGLLHFLCYFRTLDDLSISDPEWEHETKVAPVAGVVNLPPFQGTLHFLRLHGDSAYFVGLLAELPIAFRHVSLVNCQLPSTAINLLSKQLSSSLKSFSVSSWFNADCFPDIDLSPCPRIEEIRFFVGMVSAVQPPLRGIYNTLGSVSSHRVQMITLDLDTEDAMDASGKEYLRSLRQLDANLYGIASAYRGVEKTVVKLSSCKPFAVGSCLRRLRQRGTLILGIRSGEPFGFGNVRWFNA